MIDRLDMLNSDAEMSLTDLLVSPSMGGILVVQMLYEVYPILMHLIVTTIKQTTMHNF